MDKPSPSQATAEERPSFSSVDFDAQPHLLPFVGNADERASESGFAGQIDGRSVDDPDGNWEHSRQRALVRKLREADLALKQAIAAEESRQDGVGAAVDSSAADDLAAGLELLRRAARKATGSRDARVEALSEEALYRLRSVKEASDGCHSSRVDVSVLEGTRDLTAEEILSLIERVSRRICRIPSE